MAPRTRKEETREEDRKQAKVEVEIEEIRISEQLEYLNSIFILRLCFRLKQGLGLKFSIRSKNLSNQRLKKFPISESEI